MSVPNTTLKAPHLPARPVWRPPLFPKQMDVFNARQRFLLASGPRLSGKTFACLNRIVRHAWEINGARIAMFSKTIKNARSAGVWRDLIGLVIKRAWLPAGLCSPYSEFEYTTEPKQDGSTRMHWLGLRNYWGTESEIQLHSLDYDGDVEDKLLETSYSMIYFSELQKFESEDVFNISIAQLRMSEVPYEDHMWMSDTNPPESGPNHFGYHLWFVAPTQKDHPDPDWQRKFGLIQFTVDDNLSEKAQKEIDDLKNIYRDDPEGWERFILGKWTHSSGHSSKHFSALFRRNVHLVGETPDYCDPDTWDIYPSEDCDTLITGWDMGHTNHAFHIIERVLNLHGESEWYVLDELVSINEKVSVEEFGYAVLEKIEHIEKLAGRPLKWDHWSDTSAFRFNAQGTDEMDSVTIERISKGRIRFLSARNAKGPGSVRKRVEVLQKLLKQNRLFVSAKCTATIAMFEKLRKGHKELDFVQRGDEHKHPFDSLSYPIYSEMLNDLEEDSAAPIVGKRLISVPL